jgi:hypothetical protein
MAVGPAAATTEVKDIDGGPPWGCWWQGPAAATTEVEDVDGGPPWGCLQQGPAAATTEVEDVDGGLPRGAGAGDLGVQRLRSPPLG